MAITYLRLFPATQQFELRNGQLDVAGQLKVFYEGTDDLAGVYDVDGSQLPQPVILDDNGRAQGLFVDSARVYRLEVYDRYGELLYTVRKMVPSGGGAGSALGNTYEIVSSDGSIEINSTEEGSKTTYDIGIAPGNSDEFLEWCKCVDSGVIDGPLYPTMSDGTMESAGGQGLHVGKDRFYHITCSFKIYPKGDDINYKTLVAKLMFNDGEDHQVTVRGFDIDNSVHDPLLCEFSYDFKAPEDGYLFLDIDGASAFTMVDCELQVHRIYSGINAVPDTCATKQFVSENYQPLSGMSSYVAYSAIGGNVDGQVTGINGSSIAATVDTATLTSYFISNSAFTSYSSNVENILINMENNVFDISSTVSGLTGTYLEQSASALFAPSGDYAYNSSVSSKVDQSAFDNCCSSMSSTVSALETSVTAISSNVSGLTGVYLEQSASSLFQPSGDYAYNSALSGKLDTSAFSGVSGNFVQNSAFTSYTASALTSIDNSISSIQSSISSISSDVSGKVDQSAMSAWIPYSALDYSGSAISGIGGSSLAGMGGGGADYTGIYPVNVDNTAREIAVDSLPLITDSSMTSYASGDSSVIGVNLDIMSGKLDSSAQVVTATATQLYAGTAYLTSVNDAPVSASRAGQAANASMATSAYYDGTGRLISALPDSAAVSSIASGYASGKVDTSAMSSYIPYSALSGDGTSITGISGSAIGGGGATGDYVEKSATEVAIGSDNNATTYSFAQGSGNSASSYSLVQGYINHASSYSLVQGYVNQASSNSFAQGSQNKASYNSFAQGNRNSADAVSFAQGERNSANAYSFAQGNRNSASYWSFAQGSGISAKNIAAVFGLNNLHGDGDTATGDSAAFAIGDGTASGARHDLMVVTKDGEITMYSSTADTTGTGIMSAIRAISAAATGGGGIDSATCSAIASSYAESAASSKQDSSSMSSYVPFSAISADENSAITSINGSSIGGGTQVVTATGSGYPAMFAGISSINGSALIANKLSGAGYMIGSGDQGLYLTGTHGTAYYKANEMIINRSGYGEQVKFNLGSAGAQVYGSAAGDRGAFIQMNNDNHVAFFGALSGGDAKIELDGYSAGSANMAGWDSTWGTVSSQSANWGGSALALSAGPGVKLEKVGDTLVASTDETVLWSGSANTTAFSADLPENVHNFKYLEIYAAPSTAFLAARVNQCTKFVVSGDALGNGFYYVKTDNIESNTYYGEILYVNMYNGGNSFSFSKGCRWVGTALTTGVSDYRGAVTMIVGVNRTAGV